MKGSKIQIRQNQLIDLVSSFCDSELNEEYKQVCIKLIEMMAKKRRVLFKRGKIEIWASAVIYAIIQINVVYNENLDVYTTPEVICDYFDTSVSIVSDKVSMIQDLFKIKQIKKEFLINNIEVNEDNVSNFKCDSFFEDIYTLFEDGNVDEALAKLETIDENHPEYNRAAFYKSVILSSEGDNEAAEELFNRTIGNLNGSVGDILSEIIDHDDPSELFTAGVTCYEHGDYASAINFFDSVLKFDSNDVDTLYMKSNSLSLMGEYKKALKEINKAIKINSVDEDLWAEKGNIFAQLNKVNKALKCFDKAIELNPNDALIWCSKGEVYFDYEKFDNAFECYEKAYALDSDNIESLIGMANVCIFEEKFNEARKYLDVASKIDDKDLFYLNSQAHLATCQKDYKTAIKFYDKCIEIDGENPLFFVFKAFTYALWDKEDKFDECIDKAIELDPDILLSIDELLDDFNN